jgi:hypothetical protein
MLEIHRICSVILSLTSGKINKEEPLYLRRTATKRVLVAIGGAQTAHTRVCQINTVHHMEASQMAMARISLCNMSYYLGMSQRHVFSLQTHGQRIVLPR